MNLLGTAIVSLLLAALVAPLHAGPDLDGKKAEKLEVRHSMLGFRNTLLFYTFKGQRAVLQLSISNKDESFAVSGKVHLFDGAATEDGIRKWINNQHSDGLFADIPEPVFSGDLPKGACKVTSHKLLGTSKNPGPTEANFKEYEVKLSIPAHEVDGKFKLAAFTDTARVHVESK